MPFDNPFGDPQAMALLGLSQGLLAAGGPQRMPVGIGAALGQGIGGALSGAMNTQKMNQQQALVDLEKAKADMTRQQLAQAQAQFAMQQKILAQAGLLPGGSASPVTGIAGGMGDGAEGSGLKVAAVPPSMPGSLSGPLGMPQAPQGAFPFNPTQIAAMRIAGMPDLAPAYKLAQPDIKIEGGIGRDMNAGGKVLFTQPVVTANGQMAQLVQQPDGTFRAMPVTGANDVLLGQRRAEEQAKAERDLVTVPATAPNAPPTFRSRESLISGGAGAAPAAGMSPAATASQAADAAQQTDVSKNYGKIYNDLQNSSMANPAKIAKFQQIGTLLDGFEGGKLSKTGFDIAKAANSAGLKIDPRLPNKEAAEAMAGEIALDLRSTSSGGGMPGAMSDADREFLKGMTPNMAQTDEGRKTIIDARVKVMERENKVADMARQYRKKYGRLDDDFFTQLSGWSARNPIFGKK